MAIGDVYRIAAVWSDSTLVNQNINVFHFRQLDTLEKPTAAEDLVGRFLADCGVAYAACVSASLSLRIVQFRTLTVPASGVDIDAGPIVGTLPGEQNLPRQCSAVLSWRTGFIGRSYRGRTYLPTLTEDQQNDGVLISGYIDRMDDFASTVLAMSTNDPDFASWELVVHSDTVPANTPVVSWISDPIIGTQRRRKYGVGA